jgi:hypothetical protein
VSSVTKESLAAIVIYSELKDYGKYRYSTIGFTLLGQDIRKYIIRVMMRLSQAK